MNRLFLATVATTIAAVAVPALAHDTQIMMQTTTAPGVNVAASAGVPLPAPSPLGVVPVKGREVSGSVVLSTPGEIIVHTPAGLQSFQITPQTRMVSGVADGEKVSVFYAPARGARRGTAVGTVRPDAHADTKVSDRALVVTPGVAGTASR